MEVKYSVLIPVYNVEKYLNECVDSVLSQTFQNFEIILVNDGSTDSSGKMCDEYAKKDNRVKVFHQENEGLFLTRRFSISKAEGEFLLFLDSDDFWDADLLETIDEYIEKYSCDLIIFKLKRVSETGVFILEEESLFKDEILFIGNEKEKLFKIILSSSKLNNLVTKAVKRENAEFEYENFSQIRNGEDLIQSLPIIFKSKKILYLGRAFYNYRSVPTSITKTFDVKSFDYVTIAREEVLKYMKKLKIDNNKNLSMFFTQYTKFICNYLHSLIISNYNISEKLRYIKKIKEVPLFVEALIYYDSHNYSLEDNIRMKLFLKNKQFFLFIYEKTVYFMKKTKKAFKNENKKSSL